MLCYNILITKQYIKELNQPYFIFSEVKCDISIRENV